MSDIAQLTMPIELTAEDGFKAALMGEFKEKTEVTCTACYFDEGDPGELDCELCGGLGGYIQEVPISWTTIKEIYSAAVAHQRSFKSDAMLQAQSEIIEEDYLEAVEREKRRFREHVPFWQQLFPWQITITRRAHNGQIN